MAPTIPECPRTPPEALAFAPNIAAPELPSIMAARGFFVCRAAGGLSPIAPWPQA